jgi:undecaprenyl-diphosphatase
MDKKFKHTIFLIISLITLIGFGVIAILVHGQKVVQIDNIIINSIQGLESPLFTIIMRFFTFLGSGSSIIILAIVSMLIFYLMFKIRSELLLFLLVLIGSNAFFITLKIIFHRARPDLHRLIEVGGYSFPSGHSTNAVAVYGILTFILWRHISTRWGRTILVILSVFMILTIGISRIYLGVHYPSDVIGGYMVGGFLIIIAIWLYQYYKERQYEQKHNLKVES